MFRVSGESKAGVCDAEYLRNPGWVLQSLPLLALFALTFLTDELPTKPELPRWIIANMWGEQARRGLDPSVMLHQLVLRSHWYFEFL